MKPDDFEAHMRKGEWFHSLRIPEGMWFVVRLDGRGFTKMTKEMGFPKPFADEFHGYMVRTVQKCMEDFQGVFATTHSDEISILFRPEADFFDREVEKIVSTTAAVASTVFSVELGDIGTFDSRIWIGASISDVVDYFSWRCEDATRGAINSYAYWLLRQQKGATQGQATRELMRKNFAWKNEFLFKEFGLNFNDTPAWHRRGSGFHFTIVDKIGYNPIRNEEVKTVRRALRHELNLPMKDRFRTWLSTNLRFILDYPELRGSFHISAASIEEKPKEI